jgi:GDP-mannose transporter
MQVLSSVVAAWADVGTSITDPLPLAESGFGTFAAVKGVVHRVNIGYLWMFTNCVASAAYVRIHFVNQSATLTYAI